MTPTYTNKDRAHLQDIIERQVLNPPDNAFSREADEPESKLSKRIRQDCKDKGWPALVFPQHKKLSWFLPEGWPDCTIFLPKKRLIVIELKTPKGPLREKQKLLAQMFINLGYEWYSCRTWKRYMEILHGYGKEK